MNTHPKPPSRFLAGPLCVLLFLCAIALSASPLQAQCKQWNVSGQWVVQQSDGYAVTLDLRQNGTAITGSASHNRTYGGETLDAPFKRGVLEGNIEGDDFYMNITWGRETHGIYRGKVNVRGRLEGTMYHKEIPKNKAKWFSSKAMKCADAPPAAPVPAPRPVDTRPTKPPPVTPPAPAASTPAETPRPSTRPMRPPFILANPAVVTVRAQQSAGTTTLVWDAGADHPYAEVWMSVNGGDEQRIVEQGKGSREVTVQPGKSYIYSLTDAGEPLGRVAVQVQRIGN